MLHHLLPCSVATEPPTDPDEWVGMPGAKRGLRSLSLDAPGFTICFDAASEVCDAEAGEHQRLRSRDHPSLCCF